MKVRVELSAEYDPPYAVVYASSLTEEVRRIVDLFEEKDAPLIGRKDERMILLKPKDVYLVRVEGSETVIYTQKGRYSSRQRLYEILSQLGGGFMQIGKSSVVNLSRIQSVEAGFSGTLLLKMENGITEYVSRKYLPDFKSYLGL